MHAPLVALLLLQSAGVSDLEKSIRMFSSAYAAIEESNSTPVNPYSIYEYALPSLLRSLDPHSAFLTPAQVEQLREMQRSTSRGFGTIVSVLPGRVIVLQTVDGGPSARAGIAAGDEIVAVNGYRLDMLDMEQLVGLLGQTRQMKADLWVRRPGTAKLMQFTLTPEELASPSVDRAFLLEPGIAFVRITSFEGETAKQLRDAIEGLGGPALSGMVLDLRNNGGGIVNSAFDAAALFLAPGKKVATVRGRARAAEEVMVPADATPYAFSIAVLVNEKTASAAEILAGALQDHDRARIFGTATFGKGLVQSVYPVSDGAAIALTTAFYFTPSGRSIQRPLKEGQLEGPGRYSNLEGKTEFRTAAGRPVRGGGGIEPDQVVNPEGLTRLRAVLDASGVLTAFATEFLQKKPTIDRGFQVSDELLDELQLYLSERSIRPSIAEWSPERDWVRSRVRQEIFNQALGVAAGDEVEMQRDRLVRWARDAVQ